MSVFIYIFWRWYPTERYIFEERDRTNSLLNFILLPLICFTQKYRNPEIKVTWDILIHLLIHQMWKCIFLNMIKQGDLKLLPFEKKNNMFALRKQHLFTWGTTFGRKVWFSLVLMCFEYHIKWAMSQNSD